MSDETHYTVLGIPERATQDEIKRAYRELIRQVHPDHVPNASPYWKRAAEEKSKELNEAYHVLIDPKRRRPYDRELAEYRRRFVPASTNWSPEVDVNPPDVSNNQPSDPQERSRKREYNWQPLIHWAYKYPFLAGCLALILFVPAVSFLTGLRPHKAALAADSALASDGSYSGFPCLDPHDAVSPIDGKPCRRPENTVSTPDTTDPKPPIKLTTPKWFYATSKGIRPLKGVPDDDTCNRINAKNSAACEASLKFCPLGVWSKDCVSYSKWKQSNGDPPRVEKLIPVWPSQ